MEQAAKKASLLLRHADLKALQRPLRLDDKFSQLSRHHDGFAGTEGHAALALATGDSASLQRDKNSDAMCFGEPEGAFLLHRQHVHYKTIVLHQISRRPLLRRLRTASARFLLHRL